MAEQGIDTEEDLDLPNLPVWVEEAFAVSLNPQQFEEALWARDVSLHVFREFSPPLLPGEDMYKNGQIIAVYNPATLFDYPLPPVAEKWGALALTPDQNLITLHQAFEVENGADFSSRLRQENIFLALPTPEECEEFILQPGEPVAVTGDLNYPMEPLKIYPLREEFEAAERSLQGKWIEKNQAFYEARHFDTFMEDAARFDSIAEVEAERQRAAARVRLERAQARMAELRQASREPGHDLER